MIDQLKTNMTLFFTFTLMYICTVQSLYTLVEQKCGNSFLWHRIIDSFPRI